MHQNQIWDNFWSELARSIIQGDLGKIEELIPDISTLEMVKHHNPGIIESSLSTLSRDNIKAAEFLLKIGADVNYHGGEPLSLASAKGLVNLVRFLIKNGADIKKYGGSALFSASENCRLEIVKILIEAGVDVDSLNGNSLSWATFHGFSEIVKVLLEAGADFNLNGGAAKRWMFMESDAKIVYYFMKHGAELPYPLSKKMVDILGIESSDISKEELMEVLEIYSIHAE